MTPYYQSPDGAVVVYNDRWEDVVAAGLVPVREVALVHADPPYGIGLDTRARWPWLDDFPAVEGDEEPFDPAALVALARPSVLWGANHYASKLPDVKGWITWDKATRNDLDLRQAEIELAWSTITARPQSFRHMWSGAFRDSERGTRFHPTQKPIALCSWVYARAKLKPGAFVFVPYMGSGPDLAACVAAGLRCIACEVEEEYCRVAVGARLHAAPKPDIAGPLFDRVPR